MTWKAPLPLACVALLAFPPPLAAADEPFLPFTETVQLDAANPSAREIGALTYRGGVAIEPGEEEIGGITGVEWHDGQLFAITSDGRWFSFTPDAIQNNLVDVIEAETGNLLDERGKKLSDSGDQIDSTLSRTTDGNWLVGLKGTNDVLRYTELTARPQPARAQKPAEVFGPESAIQIDQAVGELVSSDCGSGDVCFALYRSGDASTGYVSTIFAASTDGNYEQLARLPASSASSRFSGLSVREETGRHFLYLITDNGGDDSSPTLLMKFEVSERAATAPGVPAKVYATQTIVLNTQLGPITISLETERAPITAANFLRYVSEDRFDGAKCYRAMRVEGGEQPAGFLQCGAQNYPDRILDPIAHEPTTETGLSHTNGALSMARFAPGTATGDFSVMIRDQRGLDAQPNSDDPDLRPGFAVFGYVTDGMDVVHAIHAAPIDPDEGEGFLRGQMLAEPVMIIDARQVETPDEN